MKPIRLTRPERQHLTTHESRQVKQLMKITFVNTFTLYAMAILLININNIAILFTTLSNKYRMAMQSVCAIFD